MMARQKFFLALLLSALVCMWVGCHAYGVDVTIQNNGSVPVHNVEVDYPHASFGVPVIQPGKSFWYHIKPTEQGTISISFEPENGKAVRKQGPEVRPGAIEKLSLTLEQDSNHGWQLQVQH
ncbi:MAG: hypothetical protein JOZ10_08705 [Acidobacteria bacterium]|nr:hypothetical protein [Acidobacteriota bacterium]MBV9437880.1 hypothetical protein [Acidobacteriota bacterium]